MNRAIAKISIFFAIHIQAKIGISFDKTKKSFRDQDILQTSQSHYSYRFWKRIFPEQRLVQWVEGCFRVFYTAACNSATSVR